MPAQRAATCFRQRFGKVPQGVWAAPGRVNIIGEHTDYNDGFVLPVAIERRTAVAASKRTDGVLNLFSAKHGEAVLAVDDIAPGTVSGWPAYPAGALWSLRQAGAEIGGMDLAIESDVPAGGGLSSSAALECAVVLAAAELYDVRRTPMELALIAQRGEVEIVGMPCGIMDQTVAMLATARHALLLDARSLETVQVPLPLARGGFALLVIDTRAPHRLVDGAYAERRAACEKASKVLGITALRDATMEMLEEAKAELGDVGFRRARHVVTENDRVRAVVALLTAGRLDQIGPALSASHASLRDDYEVSVPELDVAVEAAMAGGAIGARMTGAGFGGSVVAIGPAASGAAILRSVNAAFAESGFRPPHVYTVSPSGGATRVE